MCRTVRTEVTTAMLVHCMDGEFNLMRDSIAMLLAFGSVLSGQQNKCFALAKEAQARVTEKEYKRSCQALRSKRRSNYKKSCYALTSTCLSMGWLFMLPMRRL